MKSMKRKLMPAILFRKQNNLTFKSRLLAILIRAMSVGNLHVVKWLINNTAVNIKSRNKQGATILHYAAALGDLNVLEWLLNNTQLKYDASDKKGLMPLHYAAFKGHQPLVACLYTLHHTEGKLWSIKELTYILFLAINSKSDSLLDWIWNEPMQMDATLGGNVLLSAAEYGQFSIAQWLIEYCNINPDEEDALNNDTTLHFAIKFGADDVVKWLYYLDPELLELANFKNYNALHYAVGMGREDIMNFIIDNSPELLLTEQTTGDNLLHLAIEHQNLAAVMRLILDESFDLNQPNSHGETPLQIAVAIKPETTNKRYDEDIKIKYDPLILCFLYGEYLRQKLPIPLDKALISILDLKFQKQESIYSEYWQQLSEVFTILDIAFIVNDYLFPEKTLLVYWSFAQQESIVEKIIKDFASSRNKHANRSTLTAENLPTNFLESKPAESEIEEKCIFDESSPGYHEYMRLQESLNNPSLQAPVPLDNKQRTIGFFDEPTVVIHQSETQSLSNSEVSISQNESSVSNLKRPLIEDSSAIKRIKIGNFFNSNATSETSRSEALNSLNGRIDRAKANHADFLETRQGL